MAEESEYFPITEHLDLIRMGDAAAESRLFEYIYDRLKLIAVHRLGGSAVGDPSATIVVHEAYLRLRSQYPNILNRKHFFRLAAKIMQSVLVDEHRKRSTASRGGGWSRTEIELEAREEQSNNYMAGRVSVTISELAELDTIDIEPLLLNVYCGFTRDQIADVLDWDVNRVRRELDFTKAWLRSKLADCEM